jgi:arginine decarboxylase
MVPPAGNLADFFSAAEARTDRWRQIFATVRAWQAINGRTAEEEALFAKTVTLLSDVAALEGYFAYPGPRLMAAIEHALAERNSGVCARLVQHVSSALLTGAYRYDTAAWDPLQEESAGATELMPPERPPTRRCGIARGTT